MKGVWMNGENAWSEHAWRTPTSSMVRRSACLVAGSSQVREDGRTSSSPKDNGLLLLPCLSLALCTHAAHPFYQQSSFITWPPFLLLLWTLLVPKLKLGVLLFLTPFAHQFFFPLLHSTFYCPLLLSILYCNPCFTPKFPLLVCLFLIIVLLLVSN